MANPQFSEISLWRATLPFRFAFSHNLASRSLAETLVLEIKTTHRGVGYGQVLPRSYLTGETLESAALDLQNRWWPAFAAMRPGPKISADAMAALFAETYLAADAKRQNASYAAVDMAAMAAWSNAGGVEFPAWEKPLPLVGVISALGPRPAYWLARLLYVCGYRRFKVKVGRNPDADRERLRAVRRAIGSSGWLAVDANAAWSMGEIEPRLAMLREFQVALLEEPLISEDSRSADYRYLEKVGKIPIMADESLCTLADARRLLQKDGPSWWNLRLAKSGGFAGLGALAQLGRENGINLYGGILVGETGALAAASRAGMYLAGTVMGEYGFSRVFLKNDPFRGSPAGYSGYIKPPDIHGGMKVTLVHATRAEWENSHKIFSNTSVNS